MWNKSTRADIQAMFDDMQDMPGLDRIFRLEGLILRRDDSTAPGKSPEYMKEYFKTDAGKAARKRYNDANREKRNAYSRAYRAAKRALRVAERAYDAGVMHGARQVG